MTVMDKQKIKLRLKSDWAKVRNQLRSRYSELTEADLDYTIGEEEKLFSRIEKKTGVNRKEIFGLLDA
jgi:hypothetical protein